MTDRDYLKIALTLLFSVAGFLAVYSGSDLPAHIRLLAAALVAAGPPVMAVLDPPGKKPDPDRLTAAQTRQVADELERRMKRTPSKGGG